MYNLSVTVQINLLLSYDYGSFPFRPVSETSYLWFGRSPNYSGSKSNTIMCNLVH